MKSEIKALQEADTKQIMLMILDQNQEIIKNQNEAHAERQALKEVIAKIESKYNFEQAKSLKTAKSVAAYLKISTTTLDRYIRSGKLIRGIHYSIENNKRLFIASGIIELEKVLNKGAHTLKSKDVMPSSNAFTRFMNSLEAS